MTDTNDVNEHSQVVHLRLPVTARFFRVARVVAGALADEFGADIDELDDVRLAVGEICSLALTAGAREVDLRFELTHDSLIVSGDAIPASTDYERQLRFTRSILAATAAEYELDAHPGAVTFRLRFTGNE